MIKLLVSVNAALSVFYPIGSVTRPILVHIELPVLVRLRTIECRLGFVAVLDDAVIACGYLEPR